MNAFFSELYLATQKVLELFFSKAEAERYEYDSADACVCDVIPQLFELRIFSKTLSWKGLSEARKLWKIMNVGVIQNLLKEGKFALNGGILPLLLYVAQ
jgi:hypothetical protein